MICMTEKVWSNVFNGKFLDRSHTPIIIRMNNHFAASVNDEDDDGRERVFHFLSLMS